MIVLLLLIQLLLNIIFKEYLPEKVIYQKNVNTQHIITEK